MYPVYKNRLSAMGRGVPTGYGVCWLHGMPVGAEKGLSVTRRQLVVGWSVNFRVILVAEAVILVAA